MKKLVLLVATALTLCSCGGNNNPSRSDIEVPETPDGYVDVLPEETKDGNILHAFCWAFNQIKENLPSIAYAGFRSVETMPVQQPKGGGSSWWSYYQPLSFSIADNSQIGTKEELKELCEEADKYNISIIADVVFNHMANTQDKDYEPDETPKVNPDVAKYEPYIYEHRNDDYDATFHHNKYATGSGAITQVYQYGDLPDLNTANKHVQGRCLDLLKECIDVGIDGFRIDTAKHVETPTDPEYASDFWPNVVDVAKEYYKEKNDGDELFIWGEVLGEPGGGRKISDYTTFMNVTDDAYIGGVHSGVNGRKAQKVAEAKYGKNTDANNLITWVESHDTYTSATTHIGEKKVAKEWAVVGSRKGSRALYLARPDDALTIGKIGDYAFESEYTAVINRFHNRFVGGEEYQGYEGNVYYIERVKDNSKGAVILDVESTGHVKVTLPHLGTGIYYDQLTGRSVKVIEGECDFDTDEYGVAVLTMSKNPARPRIKLSSRGEAFVGSLELDITVDNVDSFNYKINDKAEVTVTTGNVKVTLGDDVREDNTIAVQVIIGDLIKNLLFKKVELIPGKFNVINLKPEYFTDYELYIWKWVSSGSWTKDYTVQDGVLLYNATGLTGFLLGLFPKGYVIRDVNKWDEGIIKQTGDIKGAILKAGFYDASNF